MVATTRAPERRDLSFVDITSFQVMRRLSVSDAFTFDRHFGEQGFTLRPSPEPSPIA